MKTGTSDSARNTAQLRNDLEMKLTQDLLESPFEKIIAELYKTR